MKRFNLNVYFPFETFDAFWENFADVKYSRHLKQRCKEKNIPKPTKEILQRGTVIECETDDSQNFVTKIVVRIPSIFFVETTLNLHRDYCYVVNQEGKVISAWVNKHKDRHPTLNKGNYERCP